MKLQGAAVERFLSSPDPAIGAVLIFGPDEGLVRERAERLLKGVLDPPDDPFRLSEFMADQLRSDPARLADEARALTLMGGRRVVRVRQASDLVVAPCRTLLELERFDALVLIEAGDLPPSSPLRKLFEGGRRVAALPCYRDLARELAALIQATLREHGLEPEPDALSYLVDHLGGDRGLTRAELDKLLLYLDDAPGDAPPGRRRVTVDMAAAVIGDSAALGLDDLVDAAACGELEQLERCLDRLLGEGEHPVRLVRSLANHLVRLDRLGTEGAAGGSIDQRVERARPPIHFRRRERVKAALRRWPPAAARAALGFLVEVEIQCKTTGMPAELICRNALLEVARAARRAAPERLASRP